MASIDSSRSPGAASDAPDWSEAIHRLFAELQIEQIGMVPDGGHARLIRLIETDGHTKLVRLTTEEEGVALATGAWLGGERTALLMQSSGVGNCINMLSLSVACSIPLFMLVTMRGDWGEFNPWQVPMGQAARASLEAIGVLVWRADTSAEVVEKSTGAARIAFNASRPTAVLIGQNVLGAKDFKELTKR